jgi:hypothetical protein
MTVLLEDLLLEGSRIDPDSYGCVSFPRFLDDFFNGFGVPYVPRIDSKAVCAGVKRSQGQAVVEMDICDQGRADLFSDFSEGMGRLHVRDSQSDDLTARIDKAVNLPDCCPNIPGVRVRHGLDRNGRIPSNRNVSHMDNPGFSSGIDMRGFLMIHS